MKLQNLSLFLLTSLLLFSGCAGGPKPPKEAIVDTTLPVVELTRAGIIADMNSIAFEWKSIRDPRVEGFYIYKLDASKKEPQEEHYDTLTSRFITHYLDKKIEPNSQYSYYFRTYSKDAQSSKSQTYSVTSLPVLESVAWIDKIDGMPRSTKIVWRPHVNEKVKSYIIERRTLESEEWKKLDEIEGRLNAEYIDQELKDNFTYKYRVRVRTFDNIVSTPSQIVTVVTKALPEAVSGIKATLNIPKKIILDWDASRVADFKYYNIYRATSSDGHYERIASLTQNHYEDLIERDGAEFYYRVSVVDKDGLESIYDGLSIQGVTLNPPAAPSMVEAKLVGTQIVLRWVGGDSRARGYIVAKRFKQGWFDEVKEEYTDIKGTTFTDSAIEPNANYFYTLYAVDANGIRSLPTIEVSVKSHVVENYIPQPKKESKAQEQVVAPLKESKSKEQIIPTNDFMINEI